MAPLPPPPVYAYAHMPIVLYYFVRSATDWKKDLFLTQLDLLQERLY